MRPATVIVLTVLVVAGISAQRDPSTARKPNVLLIITDDVGYGDFGSYGAPDIKTPNVDRLAKEGVRFTDFYANGAVCTPTRAGLISGRYQQRVGLEQALSTSAVDLQRGLPVTGRSLPQLLKNNGYATALVGKWHLGFRTDMGPNVHGFDYFYGFLSGAVNYFQHVRGDGEPDLYENTTPVKESGYLTDILTRRSIDFINRNAGRPFFLEVAYNAAHWPFQSPHHQPNAFPADRGTIDQALNQPPGDPTNPTRKDYAEMLERADQGIGQILATLDRHGLTRNTFVIFTNDNGGEWLSRNAPLFHRKATLWEGGIRVPAIFRWPDRVPRGKTTAQVGITMDLTATILAATGTPAPDGARLDGMDLLPLIQNAARPLERTLFWRIAGPARQQRAVRQGSWKLLVDGGQFLLFDLSKDIGERNDLAMARPDVVAQLRQRILGWEKDVDSEGKARTTATGLPVHDAPVGHGNLSPISEASRSSTSRIAARPSGQTDQ
jgi:arylsulfatase A-like enzyme